MSICLNCSQEFKKKRKEQIYCSRSCASVPKGKLRFGQKTGPRKNWIYKKQIDKDGYIRVYAGLHPYTEGRLMIQEHVMVMEKHLGRRLLEDECVHHLNQDRTDNRLSNLKLMKKSKHSKLHALNTVKKRDARGHFA